MYFILGFSQTLLLMKDKLLTPTSLIAEGLLNSLEKRVDACLEWMCKKRTLDFYDNYNLYEQIAIL